MGGPVAARAVARFVLAVGGGWLLALGRAWGWRGSSSAVALGITAYGVIAAAAVRPGVWR